MTRKTSVGEKGRSPYVLSQGKRSITSAAAVIFTVLMLLIVIFYGAVSAVIVSGEKKLRDIKIYRPVLLDIDTENVSAEAEQEWKEGWVRYQGDIYEYNESILTFLFLGIDKMEKVSPNTDKVSGGQSDAIFLLAANPDTKQISIIGVNRDTMVDVRLAGIADDGGDIIYNAQLAVQHGFGDGMKESCELTRDAVSALFYQLPIHGYVSFNMGGTAALNDALGGVELPVLGDDMTGFKKSWTEGTWITLTGNDAFEYVHYRDPDIFESSRMRLERQKQYLSAFGRKAAEAVKNDIMLPVTLYNKLKDYVVTDIEIDEMVYLAKELSGYQFSADHIYGMEGTTRKGDFEEFYPDKTALKELMIQVFYHKVTD